MEETKSTPSPQTKVWTLTVTLIQILCQQITGGRVKTCADFVDSRGWRVQNLGEPADMILERYLTDMLVFIIEK